MSKGKAFGLCLNAILFIFLSMLIVGMTSDKPEIIPVTECLTGIGSLAGIYIIGSVANNGVKGKFWNQQMHDSENGGRV